MKKHLGGMYCPNEEKPKEEVLSYFRGTTGELYDSGIKKIVQRMKKCIDLNSD